MASFVVIVTNPDDPDAVEYHGPFPSADGCDDSEHDAVTWMARYIQAPVTATAVEMFEPWK